MPDPLREKYNIEALQKRIPQDRAELFSGFVPWSQDCENWNLSTRQSLPEAPGRPLTRTVWTDPSNSNARVLIDVANCASATEAMEALVDRLAANQLQLVPEGPEELGEAAFQHPQGVPPAIFFVQGNLAISVASFGRQPVTVLPWARRMTVRLQERPAVERTILSFDAEQTKARAYEDVGVRYKLPMVLGDNGYVKFFVRGGTATLTDGRLVLRGTVVGQVLVEAFVVEPGREPYGGRFALTVE